MLKTLLCVVMILISGHILIKSVSVLKTAVLGDETDDVQQHLEKRPYFDIDMLPLDQSDSDKKELIDSSPPSAEETGFEGEPEPSGELTPYVIN